MCLSCRGCHNLPVCCFVVSFLFTLGSRFKKLALGSNRLGSWKPQYPPTLSADEESTENCRTWATNTERSDPFRGLSWLEIFTKDFSSRSLWYLNVFFRFGLCYSPDMACGALFDVCFPNGWRAFSFACIFADVSWPWQGEPWKTLTGEMFSTQRIFA